MKVSKEALQKAAQLPKKAVKTETVDSGQSSTESPPKKPRYSFVSYAVCVCVCVCERERERLSLVCLAICGLCELFVRSLLHHCETLRAQQVFSISIISNNTEIILFF